MIHSRTMVVLGCMIYGFVLQWAYPYVQVPVYLIDAVSLQSIPFSTFIAQNIFIIIPSLWLPLEISKPSHLQNWFIYLTVIVPTCIVPYHVTKLQILDICTFDAFLLICSFFMCRVSSYHPIRMPRIRVRNGWFVIGLIVFTVITYGWLIYYRGFTAIIIPLDDVYEVRADLRQDPYPGLLKYLYWWQGAVINPLIMAIGLYRRKWTLIVLAFILQMEMYSLTSLRNFLVSGFFELGLGLFFLKFKQRRGLALLAVMSICVVGAIGWFQMDNQSVGSLLFLDRWIYNAGQLSGYYLEYFLNHDYAGMQDSSLPFLRWVLPGPYELPMGQVIGQVYFLKFTDGGYTNATAHFWANGFGTCGYIGVILATILAMPLLWLADSVSDGMADVLVLMAFGMVSLSLTGQGTLSSILTGGIGPYILIFFLIKNCDSNFASRESRRLACPE